MRRELVTRTLIDAVTRTRAHSPRRPFEELRGLHTHVDRMEVLSGGTDVKVCTRNIPRLSALSSALLPLHTCCLPICCSRRDASDES